MPIIEESFRELMFIANAKAQEAHYRLRKARLIENKSESLQMLKEANTKMAEATELRMQAVELQLVNIRSHRRKNEQRFSR